MRKIFGGAQSARTWRRVGFWALGVLSGVYLLYVASVTAFLSFGGLAWATAQEKDARVEVKRGYSFWPGFVHFEGMKIRFQDYNIAMEIRADAGEGHIALTELAAMRVHFSWVRARGAEYRLIHRVHDPKSQAARLAAFPKIAGFDRPNYYTGPPPQGGGGKQWAVQFDSIDAEARFAWTLEYQLRGPMRARGTFRLDPNREAWVGPCEVELRGVDVFVGSERVLEKARGFIGASVDTFDPRQAPFDVVLPKLSARAQVDAVVSSLAPLDLYYREAPFRWKGAGTLHTDVHLTRGQYSSGSALLELRPLGFRWKTIETTGTGRVGLAAGPPGKFEAHATFEFPDKEKVFSVERLEAGVRFEHQTLLNTELRGGRLAVRDFHMPRSDGLAGIVPASAALPASATLDGEALLDLPKHGPAQLDLTITSTQTSFYQAGLRWGVSGNGAVQCVGTREHAKCTLDVKASHLVFNQPPIAQEATTWLGLTSKDTLVSFENATLAGEFQVRGADPKPVLLELVGESGLARLGLKLVPMGPLSGNFRVARSVKEVSVRDLDLSTGPTQVRGHFTLGERRSGAGTVETPAARVGFRLTPGGVSAHPFVANDWLLAQGSSAQ